MTREEHVYGDWLDLFGSDVPRSGLLVPDPETAVLRGLHRLHDLAEASHTSVPAPTPADEADYAESQADAVRLGTEA